LCLSFVFSINITQIAINFKMKSTKSVQRHSSFLKLAYGFVTGLGVIENGMWDLHGQAQRSSELLEAPDDIYCDFKLHRTISR
jgi:hypothetical protein